MRRDEVFDRQYPNPFDKAVYPIFDEYKKLENNLLQNFKEKLKLNIEIDYLEMRSNVFADSKDNIHFIVTMKNDIFEETQNILKKYLYFFKTYKSYVEYIQLILHDIYLLKEDSKAHGVYAQQTWQYLCDQLLIYLAITRFLILSFEQNKLTHLHLQYFKEKCSQEFDDEDVLYIDKMIIHYEMQDFFGGEINTENHFYHGVSQQHLNSWYKYFNKIRHQ